MQLNYTDTNLWEDADTGAQFSWNGSKTVRIYGSDERQVDVLTFMHQPTRPQVEAGIKRRLKSWQDA